MDYNSFGSRSDRYEKRRKNTKIINLLIILAVLLSAFLIGMVILDDDDPDGDQNNNVASDEPQNDQEEDSSTEDGAGDEQSEDETTEDDTNTDQSAENDTNDTNNNENEEESQQENTDDNESPEPQDENVKEVINKDWKPYPTEQEEPHVIELSEGSQDRLEIEMAISKAVGTPRDNLIFWWLESGGVPDRITGYVEDQTNNEYYRVPLKWIKNEGWQPQKVEVLYENLGKEKLEESRNNND